VFHKQERIQQAEGCYDKVISIWRTFLNNAINGCEDDLPLDGAQQAEAVQMFSSIHAFRTNYTKARIQAAEIDFIQSQLYFVCGEYEKCKDYAVKVLEVYEPTLGREHSQTLGVKNFLKQVQDTIRKPTIRRKSSSMTIGSPAHPSTPITSS
jgi:tetratricopeptide (TPR) repeat protein